MNQIKLIAMDMDGTLLNADRQISDYNFAALRDARKAGIHLVLSSGRIPDDISCYALKTGLDDFQLISMNGACWMEEPMGELQDVHCIPQAYNERLLQIVLESGLMYGAFYGNDIITNENPGDSDPTVVWATNLYDPAAHCTLRYLGEGINEMIHTCGVNKWIFCDPQDTGKLNKVRAKIEQEMPDLEITSSWRANIEINAPGTTKGNALQSMAARFGFSMDEVMAIGDNSNDVSMLKACRYGVAMGNGTAEAFQAASYITLNNTLDGVGVAIRALALGESIPGVRKLL